FSLFLFYLCCIFLLTPLLFEFCRTTFTYFSACYPISTTFTSVSKVGKLRCAQSVFFHKFNNQVLFHTSCFHNLKNCCFAVFSICYKTIYFLQVFLFLTTTFRTYILITNGSKEFSTSITIIQFSHLIT